MHPDTDSSLREGRGDDRKKTTVPLGAMPVVQTELRCKNDYKLLLQSNSCPTHGETRAHTYGLELSPSELFFCFRRPQHREKRHKPRAFRGFVKEGTSGLFGCAFGTSVYLPPDPRPASRFAPRPLSRHRLWRYYAVRSRSISSSRRDLMPTVVYSGGPESRSSCAQRITAAVYNRLSM